MPKKTIMIGLVDADLLCNGTRHPNLVLMKLAGFLNDNRVDFKLIIDQDEDIAPYKYIYVSRVFTFTQMPSFYEKATPAQKRKFRRGGTGFYANELNVNIYRQKRDNDMAQLERDDFLNKYPNHRGGARTNGIDLVRQMPYYHLYDEFVERKVVGGYKRDKYKDYQQYSIGFLTRGCIRHYPFCINKLEDTIFPYSELEWFLDEERDEHGRLVRPYIYLWDDNFLAADPDVWRLKLQQLIDTGRPFQFRQGLDERMLAESPYGEEMADKINELLDKQDKIIKDKESLIKAKNEQLDDAKQILKSEMKYACKQKQEYIDDPYVYNAYSIIEHGLIKTLEKLGWD